MRPWRAVVDELRRYDSAVIAARDHAGYPVSVRCVPVPDDGTKTFAVAIPDGLGVVPGPAWLLCHSHDERFWSLRSFGARGSLDRSGGEWRFRPTNFVPGMGGIGAMVRLFIGARRRARDYLVRRGVAPPQIPWDRINAIKHEVKEQQARAARLPML